MVPIFKKDSGENSSVIQNARPLELVDARFALEPHICRLAVLHGRQADFEKLENFLEAMEKKAKTKGYKVIKMQIFGDIKEVVKKILNNIRCYFLSLYLKVTVELKSLKI